MSIQRRLINTFADIKSKIEANAISPITIRYQNLGLESPSLSSHHCECYVEMNMVEQYPSDLISYRCSWMSTWSFRHRVTVVTELWSDMFYKSRIDSKQHFVNWEQT